MEARLASDVWVRAYLRRLELENIPAYVTARGDATSGAVLVKCATLDGAAVLWTRGYDLASGARRWSEMARGPEAEIDLHVKKQRGFDPDLWVIEIEARDGRTLLDEDGLA
ncbi:DUF1491 family protein [Paenirhodobacter enshiensis]|uniref:GTP-binding protein Era n=1 Tax=Paenirhodobacter enshiensis TaxID=1105367 RepID=A0A086Y9I5_9RHOB|nr:DUF1491 family protein [Paenirhodobacter enshiensis]KFI30935.1 GTP-binding protein Era [Paenirhodobacter enshiensis]